MRNRVFLQLILFRKFSAFSAVSIAQFAVNYRACTDTKLVVVSPAAFRVICLPRTSQYRRF